MVWRRGVEASSRRRRVSWSRASRCLTVAWARLEPGLSVAWAMPPAPPELLRASLKIV